LLGCRLGIVRILKEAFECMERLGVVASCLHVRSVLARDTVRLWEVVLSRIDV
jgi:hypothetical protein